MGAPGLSNLGDGPHLLTMGRTEVFLLSTIRHMWHSEAHFGIFTVYIMISSIRVRRIALKIKISLLQLNFSSSHVRKLAAVESE